MTTPFQIAGRSIGPGYPAYIIAELSANHGQNFDAAVRLIHKAKECGADAVKLQTYTADTITIRSNRPEFRVGGGTLWDGRTLHDLYQEAYTPWEWQPKLKAIADSIDLPLFSTPFDPTAVDFLEAMQVPAHKVASFELNDLPLVERIARCGKPMIVSTGMATLSEIEEAVAVIRKVGTPFSLLKCTSAYPAPPESMNLRTIPDLAARFGCPAGLSDHTMGFTVPVVAVTLGACIIEKHFTWSRAEPGPDSAFSLEPAELKGMVDAIRIAEKALGVANYGPTALEKNSLIFRRSLYVVKDVAAGEAFTETNVRSIRPGLGLAPKYLPQVLQTHATEAIAAGTPLKEEMLAKKTW